LGAPLLINTQLNYINETTIGNVLKYKSHIMNFDDIIKELTSNLSNYEDYEPELYNGLLNSTHMEGLNNIMSNNYKEYMEPIIKNNYDTHYGQLIKEFDHDELLQLCITHDNYNLAIQLGVCAYTNSNVIKHIIKNKVTDKYDKILEADNYELYKLCVQHINDQMIKLLNISSDRYNDMLNLNNEYFIIYLEHNDKDNLNNYMLRIVMNQLTHMNKRLNEIEQRNLKSDKLKRQKERDRLDKKERDRLDKKEREKEAKREAKKRLKRKGLKRR
jgi:hypothetical protein